VREVKQKLYEVIITETRTYSVIADGTSDFEAEQDAVERFHRLRKSNDLPPYKISKPRVVSVNKLAK
jgi:hypothetical protein